MSYIYLASPYSHTDAHVREQRYLAACKATVQFAMQGRVIYSPVVHWHHIALVWELPRTAAFWSVQNKGMLADALEFWILELDGWKDSDGIRWERELAEKLCKPISRKVI